MKTTPLIAIAIALVVVSSGCSQSDKIVAEQQVETQQQGLGPALKTKTADTDRDQLRSFHVAVPNPGQDDFIELAEGPFYVTGVSSFISSYAVIAFDGSCPTFEDLADQTDEYAMTNVFIYNQTPAYVPPGAVLCAGRLNNNAAYNYSVTGFVPY